MPLVNPCQSYRQVATQTASPGQLVLMLYDGALRFLAQARDGFALEDPAEHNQTIDGNARRALAIVRELNQSLDLAAGGAVAGTLRALYDYLERRVEQSALHKQPAGIDEAIARLSVLREAWAGMLQQPAGPAGASG